MTSISDSRIKINENLKEHHVEVMACMGLAKCMGPEWGRVWNFKRKMGWRADRTEGRFQVFDVHFFVELWIYITCMCSWTWQTLKAAVHYLKVETYSLHDG